MYPLPTVCLHGVHLASASLTHLRAPLISAPILQGATGVIFCPENTVLTVGYGPTITIERDHCRGVDAKNRGTCVQLIWLKGKSSLEDGCEPCVCKSVFVRSVVPPTNTAQHELSRLSFAWKETVSLVQERKRIGTLKAPTSKSAHLWWDYSTQRIL